MNEQPSQPSVFLSYAVRDKAAAETVSNAIRQAGLDVRTPDDSWAGRNLAETIAKAMRECDAFVLVATPERVNATWAPFEVGAARATGVPIFVVLTEQGPLPSYLRDFSTGSVKDVSRLVRAIRAATEPLSAPELEILADVYTEVGMPTEDLMLDPEAAARLTEQFNRRTRSTFGPERLIRELARLRKSGRLPRLRRAGRAG